MTYFWIAWAVASVVVLIFLLAAMRAAGRYDNEMERLYRVEMQEAEEQPKYEEKQ